MNRSQATDKGQESPELILSGLVAPHGFSKRVDLGASIEPPARDAQKMFSAAHRDGAFDSVAVPEQPSSFVAVAGWWEIESDDRAAHQRILRSGRLQSKRADRAAGMFDDCAIARPHRIIASEFCAEVQYLWQNHLWRAI